MRAPEARADRPGGQQAPDNTFNIRAISYGRMYHKVAHPEGGVHLLLNKTEATDAAEGGRCSSDGSREDFPAEVPPWGNLPYTSHSAVEVLAEPRSGRHRSPPRMAQRERIPRMFPTKWGPALRSRCKAIIEPVFRFMMWARGFRHFLPWRQAKGWAEAAPIWMGTTSWSSNVARPE